MYGQGGNYAPQFGQGPQRPMPPYQQRPTGLPPPPPLMQPPGPPYAVPPPPPRASAYPHALRPPPNMPQQQGPAVSMSNTGNSYPHPALNVHGGPRVQLPYSAAQQNPQHVPPPPPLPMPPPPPPPSLGPSRALPPPPPHGQALYGQSVHQPSPGTQQGIQHMPLQPPLPPGPAGSFHPANLESAKQPPTPESQSSIAAPQPPPLPLSSPPKPPPPPSSSSPHLPSSSPLMQSECGPSSVQAPVSKSVADRDDVSMSDDFLSSREGGVLDLPPPPQKPADEKVVRNIEVLCQFIAKNGPGFEEMARQKESGNPEFNFLFGGEAGTEASCAHEYYLWMKKKCGIVYGMHKGQGEGDGSQTHVDVKPSVNPDSLTIVGTAYLPVDSDVDMEDDITQSEKEPEVCNSAQALKTEPELTGNMVQVLKQDNAVQNSIDSTMLLNLSPSIKSPADPESKPENSSGQPSKMDSPIRLIQNYASDDTSEDDGEPCHEEAKTVAVSPSRRSGSTSSHEDMLCGNMDFKSGDASELGLAESAPACQESVLKKDQDDSEAVQSGRWDKLNEVSTVSSLENCEVHDRTGRAETSSPNVHFRGKEVKKDKRKTSSELKVDEFGRLLKEGASDSESDDSYHTRRHSRRGRSRSRSRSPSDRRRRRSPRRSPRRRKERRSRSRSWSPKRRRSRSRSPYKPGGDGGTERTRRDKRDCFDFLKGCCLRGASCRFLHREFGRSDNPRRYKGKQHHLEVVSDSRSSGFHGGDLSFQQSNEVKGETMHLRQDKHDGGELTFNEKSKAESIHDAIQSSVLDKDDQTFGTNAQKCEVSAEGNTQFEGASGTPNSSVPTGEENPISGMPITSEEGIDHSRAEASGQAHHRLGDESPKVDSSTNIDSATIKTSTLSPFEVPVSVPHPGNTSNVPVGPSDPSLVPPQISQLAPPHLPVQATNALQASNQVDYKVMAPSVSFPQSVPMGNAPAYLAPLSNQQFHYPIPPNPSWSMLPPIQPRPACITEPSMPGAPLTFQQGNLSLRNDFPTQSSLQTQSGGLSSHYQVGGFQHQPYPLHSGNQPTQPFGGPSLIRDDRYQQFPSQGLTTSSSFAPGSVPPQPIPFPGDLTVNNRQTFPNDNVSLSEPAKTAYQNHPFSLQGTSQYGSQQATADSMSSHLGGSLTVPGYSSDPLDKDHSSRFLDMGGSKISAHYNPYASTFDQPLTTRFSSAAFAQEINTVTGSKYDSSFNLGHAPVGQAASSHGSRKMVVSPNASRAGGRTLPRSHGDQYDPLFDSIEPSSESFKKHDQKLDHAADNSDMLKFSSRAKVLDVEENNKQKEGGVVGLSTSPENDEFGETADAEVGAVENGSPSNPDDDAINAEGEIEIDQVKGKSKKNKDSRSMKLFKVAVANFVKEVLKPQWRQGNMSKEVFKTIVKKTVDKVSGAMKNHRAPKSQAKIDHYIDSSRRKLTQLVEGYVSKYKS